ncbi:hypothetical protein [Agarivorans sp. QJM3NY_33]|uniref:hypothetical protein n=1 Tax=Agarivorans sp. QJM3NY_33 TaxID=3421432 RepID=UPI003D7CC29F
MTGFTQITNRLFYSSILATSLLMVGCGGGSDSAPANNQNNEQPAAPIEPAPVEQPSTVEPPAPSPEPAPVVSSLEQLQVAENFSFVNQQQRQLNIRYPYSQGERAYLNICTHWKNADSGSIEYSSCLWRGQISASQMALQLTVPAHASLLIAEVWQLSSGNVNSVQQQLSLAEFGTQTLTFNF